MNKKPSFVMTLTTNWHAFLLALLALGEAVWQIIYPYLNPADPHVIGGVQAVAVFLIGYIALHWLHVATTQQVVDGSATTLHPAMQHRPPYTPN